MRGPLGSPRLRRLIVGAALVVLAGTLLGASPATAVARDLRLSSVRQVVSFSGDVHRFGPTGQFPGVPQCATANCQHFVLRVGLDGAFDGKPGGVQPTIEWHQLFNDIAGLYIYRSGTLVASSDAGVATFQSARLNTAAHPNSTPNGAYDIYVAYEGYVDDNGVAPSDTISFQGWVQVEYQPPKKPVRNLLPNLLPLPTNHITFTPIAIFGDVPDPNVPSCFRSEVQENPGLSLCLRVEQRMYDENGPNRGPVEIDFSTPTGQTPPTAPVVQRIYRSDGTSYTRPAGAVVFHPVHSHYHYEDYSQSTAFAIDTVGNPVGTPVASGHKNGFCLADTDIAARQGQQYVAPMTYTAPGCLSPRSYGDGGATSNFVEGEGPGNGDTYGADLPDQYLDASHITNGTYLLRMVVDPDHKLLETNPHDNCIQRYFRLTGVGTATPTITLLDTFAGHAAPACTS